jgi:hypothetical protein
MIDHTGIYIRIERSPEEDEVASDFYHQMAKSSSLNWKENKLCSYTTYLEEGEIVVRIRLMSYARKMSVLR